ncbi:MAG: RagB/SusD family nutrient uptake outer membrane protein [Bacteroidales bacterium]|nr:RagB/SusD family nutrient uptake outer membrane protein [Bacteroidales bacterium]
MRNYVIVIVTLSVLFFTSCESWLDLQPEGEATEEEIFSTGDGYRSVLNGLYQAMGKSSLYGRELSFGMLDCMSQQYDLEKMSSSSSTEKYRAAGAFNYQNVSLTPIIEEAWKAGFNIIANANCLIQNVTNTSADLFKKGEMEKNLILGEAYACRALIHFDLLRLFAPALINDDKATYVPYVETYPSIQESAIAVEPFLEKVVADLVKAKTLVMEFDTSALGQSVSATGGSRFYNNLEADMEGYKDASVDEFFKGRGYRLSYYAMTALLARVYQYAGKQEEAFKAAKEVMSYTVKGEWGIDYDMYSYDDYWNIVGVALESCVDLKVTSNLLFAVYNEKAYEDNNLKLLFAKKSDASNWFTINMVNQKIFYSSDGVYDESGDDFRAANLIFYGNGDSEYPISAKWYLSDDEEIRDRNITIIPIIRGTEMRYIMAEYYARQGNFTEAGYVLDEIRMNRGCYTPVSIGDWEGFVKELICDARREWISEGQLFYLYKRLNAAIDFGKNVVRPLTRSEYMLPIPSDQVL